MFDKPVFLSVCPWLGRLHQEVDLIVGAGVGYDILKADETSDAKGFGAYFSTRLVVPARDPDALGVLISVGMQWQK